VYEVNDAEGQLYNYVNSISNTVSLGTTNDVSTYAVASSNVTFNVTPQKIGEGGNGGTLYILNCSDANGWWITGYTAQNLAQDLYSLLSPYIKRNPNPNRNSSECCNYKHFWRKCPNTNNLCYSILV
jgi:hypothetical protein